MTISLSILEQSIQPHDFDLKDVLTETVALAQLAESLHFKRFWVAEHHNMASAAGSAPEILLAYLAAKTEKIQLASGGVMLQHYSPFKVVEQFNTLNNLADGRISLGVGKAPGGLQASTQALQEGFASDTAPSFEEKLATLTHFTRHDFVEGHPYADLKAQPDVGTPLPLYLLGGSVTSAILAAGLGINFVYAHFINGDDTLLKDVHTAYHQHFTGDTPNFQLASVYALASSKAAAEKLITVGKGFRVVSADGKKLNLNTREQVDSYVATLDQSYEVIQQQAGRFVGTPAAVLQQLHDFHTTYGISDFIAVTPIEDAAAKRSSITALGALLPQLKILEKVV